MFLLILFDFHYPLEASDWHKNATKPLVNIFRKASDVLVKGDSNPTPERTFDTLSMGHKHIPGRIHGTIVYLPT